MKKSNTWYIIIIWPARHQQLRHYLRKNHNYNPWQRWPVAITHACGVFYHGVSVPCRTDDVHYFPDLPVYGRADSRTAHLLGTRAPMNRETSGDSNVKLRFGKYLPYWSSCRTLSFSPRSAFVLLIFLAGGTLYSAYSGHRPQDVPGNVLPLHGPLEHIRCKIIVALCATSLLYDCRFHMVQERTTAPCAPNTFLPTLRWPSDVVSRRECSCLLFAKEQTWIQLQYSQHNTVTSSPSNWFREHWPPHVRSDTRTVRSCSAEKVNAEHGLFLLPSQSQRYLPTNQPGAVSSKTSCTNSYETGHPKSYTKNVLQVLRITFWYCCIIGSIISEAVLYYWS